MFCLKSNRIVCRLNQTYFSIFDSIRFGEDFENKAAKTMTVKSEKLTENDHKRILPVVSDILVDPLLKSHQLHDCNYFSELLRRFSIESNQY
jgi:hypothetical protein